MVSFRSTQRPLAKGVPLFAALIFLPACSFYYSSESSFKTLISPSTSSASSSKSSSSSGKHSRYIADVSDAAASYARQDGSMDLPGLFSRISELAAEKGLSNWEKDADTYEAIGSGLASTGADSSRYETLRNNIAGSDSLKREQIDKGAKK